MLYKHTQIGYLMIFALLAVVLNFGFVLTRAELNPTLIAILFPILFLIASFTTLKVMVDKKYLRIKFGYGIFKKHFKLKEITSARIVKNSWYYGWGIRFWPWPHMWIYNVSGFNAVEIKMKNGKIYRIGTDKPKNLQYVITQIING